MGILVQKTKAFPSLWCRSFGPLCSPRRMYFQLACLRTMLLNVFLSQWHYTGLLDSNWDLLLRDDGGGHTHRFVFWKRQQRILKTNMFSFGRVFKVPQDGLWFLLRETDRATPQGIFWKEANTQDGYFSGKERLQHPCSATHRVGLPCKPLEEEMGFVREYQWISQWHELYNRRKHFIYA